MKRPVVFALSIAVLTTVPSVAQAHHRPGHQGGPKNSLTVNARPNPVVFQRATSIFGRYRADAPAGRAIVLQRDPWPYEGNFLNTGTATTDAQGDYLFRHNPPVNTIYRTRFGGIFSVAVAVGVRIRVSRRVSDRTPEVGQRVRFRGRACPEHDGARVRIQRRTRTGRWRTVRRTTLRNITGSTCSRYSRRFRVFRDGTYRVVVVSGDADHRNGISRRVRLNAHS